MKLYYAHYPALENRFVRFVQENRTNPLDKWLVVCASSFIAQRLQMLLARELGAIANIYFITGSTLVGRLDQEAPGDTPALLPQDHVRDFLIKEILSEPGLDRYPISRGFVQAVKSSLRDLADSLADPAILEEHLLSMPDYVLEQDGGRFEWLVHVYKRYLERENSIPGYRSYQTAFERALNQVETSAYLRSFSQIVVYGFYDMPGRQLELTNRIRACYPITVFAPYEKHPAYAFAKKFFETNWLSAPGAEEVSAPVPLAIGNSAPYVFSGSGSAAGSRVEIVSAPNVKGSVFYMVKEICKRVQAGQSLADMAIFARNITPYQEELRRACKANCLALDASFSYPLYKYALGTFCLNLLGLGTSGFSRENILAVFSSPYFKEPHKATWRRLVSRSLVSRDLSQWNDLLPQAPGFQEETLAWINQASKQLEQLTQAQTWTSGVQHVLNFLETQVDLSAFEGKDAEIYQKICETITKINAYAAVRPQCQAGELLPEIIQALSTLTFNEVESVEGGLTVTDVVRGRGLRFKTVFLLGLNDQEFPLVTPEDPILRDYYRYHLRDTLGYWINASLDRGDEEKLLFYSAITSASEQLYVLYNRYGPDGKPVVPSVYVAELARACELNLQAPDAPRVSGRLAQRLRTCDISCLTPKELSYRFVLSGASTEKYRAAGLLTEEKTRSLTAAHALAQPGPLSAYDGIISQGAQLFERENKRGFSPSALQELGACPMKYFLNRGLRLGEPEEPASRQALPANKQGTAYHEILREFYQTLAEKGLLRDLFDVGISEQMQQIIARHYTKGSYRVFGIYPVVWEIILENIRQKLSAFAVQDVKELGNFVPRYFEQEVITTPTEDLPLCLRGFIDRMDVNEDTKQFRIADYKSTRKGTTNLAKDFFTRLVFQPVMYILMAQHVPAWKKYQTAGSCLLSIDPYSKRDLSAEDYAAVKDRALAFLTQLTDLIKTGTLFMCPGEACAYCPYHLLCRKDAFKPLLRAQKSALRASLEEARRYDEGR